MIELCYFYFQKTNRIHFLFVWFTLFSIFLDYFFILLLILLALLLIAGGAMTYFREKEIVMQLFINIIIFIC